MIRAPRRALLGAATLLATPGILRAQPAFPSRPVTVVVPNPPGGGTDFAARLFQEGMQAALGQPVVVENRPGANGNIAIGAVARAQPDGHTLLLQYNGYHAGNPAMMQNLPWDPIRDFALVGMATLAPHVILVAPNVPANTLQEFIAHARANPGKLNYASSGNGSIQHIGGVLFARAIGTEMVHVPYRGAAPAVADLVAGTVDFMMATWASVSALVADGRLRALGVAGSARFPDLPEVATLIEQGFDYLAADPWFGLFAPGGTPAPVLAALHEATVRALSDGEVGARLTRAGFRLETMPPAAFQAFLAEEVPLWGRLIREAGITAAG